MDADRSITLVAQLAGIDRDSAERVTEAVLSTLTEHLALAETAAAPERFGVVEFVRRVAHRDGTDPQEAERRAGVVFLVLRQNIGGQEFADLAAQLPGEYARLLSGRAVLEPTEKILATVAWLNQTSVEDARHQSEAVLEALAQRIAPGDVADLAALLPPGLHEPLQRGLEAPDRRMTAGQLVIRVAARAGIDVERAARAIPAVVTALRQEIGDEFFDIIMQLPGEYRALLAAHQGPDTA